MSELILRYQGKLLEDLTENEISLMEPRERVDLCNIAQRHVVSDGLITTSQSANLTRLLIHIRRRAVKDNPRATAAARKAAEVAPASIDDI